MSTIGFAIFLFLSAVTAVSGQRCNCQYVEHPQRSFCEADFALRGKILGAEEVEFLLNKQKGVQEFLKYTIEIDEPLKGEDPYIEGSIVSLFTPIQGICNKGELFYKQILYNYRNDYLFTGDMVESPENERYHIITNCNWIKRWEEISEDQRAGVRGLYSDCGCLIHHRSEELNMGHTTAENFGVELCTYNPVSAVTLRLHDCETEHGFCKRGKDGICSWDSTDNFTECFTAREARLTFGAAAITEREHCKHLQGKKKKKCLLKVRKAQRIG